MECIHQGLNRPIFPFEEHCHAPLMELDTSAVLYSGQVWTRLTWYTEIANPKFGQKEGFSLGSPRNGRVSFRVIMAHPGREQKARTSWISWELNEWQCSQRFTWLGMNLQDLDFIFASKAGWLGSVNAWVSLIQNWTVGIFFVLFRVECIIIWYCRKWQMVKTG